MKQIHKGFKPELICRLLFGTNIRCLNHCFHDSWYKQHFTLWVYHISVDTSALFASYWCWKLDSSSLNSGILKCTPDILTATADHRHSIIFEIAGDFPSTSTSLVCGPFSLNCVQMYFKDESLMHRDPQCESLIIYCTRVCIQIR